MGEKINCVVVNKRPVGPLIFGAIRDALSDAKIRFTHDSLEDAFLFFISADYFPKARAVFDKLKNDGKIDSFEVKEK